MQNMNQLNIMKRLDTKVATKLNNVSLPIILSVVAVLLSLVAVVMAFRKK